MNQQRSPRPPPIGALELFSTDPGDHDSYHRVWGQARILTPHQRLAAAVLIQAIDDAMLPYRCRYHTEAWWWLFSPRARCAHYPFELCCERLGFSPSWVRRQVRHRLRAEKNTRRQRALSWGMGHEGRKKR